MFGCFFAIFVHLATLFLIYNKLDKTPLFAIEIDGATYHQTDSKQKIRDNLKNAIFEKYDLPLIRFSTKDNVNTQTVLDKLSKYIA